MLTPEIFFAVAERYAPELIGVSAIVALALFAIDYNANANWRRNPEGRSVMYLVLGLVSTILLLVIHGWFGAYPGRVFVEIAVFTPLAVACWYLRHALRQSLGLPSRWLIRVPKKSTSEADAAIDEDTNPTR